MKSNTPTLPGVIRAAIKAALIDVHTAIPGRVLSYDPVKQVAIIQPIVRRNKKTKLPAIPGVSIMFLGNDSVSIAWKVKKGDTGWLMFGEASLDKWKTGGGGDVDPGDDRRFDLSDAVFFPALRSQRNPIPAAGLNDDALVIRAPEIHAGGDQALATKADVDSLKAAIDSIVCSNGTITVVDPATVNGTEVLKGG